MPPDMAPPTRSDNAFADCHSIWQDASGSPVGFAVGIFLNCHAMSEFSWKQPARAPPIATASRGPREFPKRAHSTARNKIVKSALE
jgi:hypothetical protein